MKNKLYRIRLIGIIFIYLIAALFTLIDKLTFLDYWDMGINLEYWESNTIFLVTVAFWFNLFLYSILPALVARLAIKDKVVTYCSLVLPVFFGYLLYLSVIDTGREFDLHFRDLKYFVYGLLFVSIVVISVKLIFIARSLKVEQTIEDLEKFKERALKKLAKVNPEVNQKLYEALLGNNGKAYNLLRAAAVEQDQEYKHLLMRLALDAVVGEDESIEILLKRLTRLATIKENNNSGASPEQ